jgi:hypothetical protein
VGALGFATAQPGAATPVWNPQSTYVVHAHGYLAETFADFGLIGLAVSIALLVAWAIATATTLEVKWPRRRIEARPPPSGNGQVHARQVEGLSGAHVAESPAERAGLVAMFAVVLTFGVHSLIDWTWFIPGVAVPALACAGWLVGRGPLSAPTGWLPRAWRLARAPTVAAAGTLLVVLMVVAVWVIVQPLRSFDSLGAAETAAIAGNGSAALADARAAAVEDPVSIDPLFLLSQIYAGFGDPGSARRELVDAASRQPSNPATWQELGCYDYLHHDQRVWREFLRLVRLQPDATAAQTQPATYCASFPG